MGALGASLRILQYVGLCFQLHPGLLHGEVDNHISGRSLFTEVPHDITAQSGEDVELACSFRGSASPSYSLEIQWWYIKDHRDHRQAKTANMTNNNAPLEDTPKDATKISVVKVAGGDVSHKLRLSGVRPSDEGTYECCVIDFGGSVARVRAYVKVRPVSADDVTPRERGRRSPGGPAAPPPPARGDGPNQEEICRERGWL